MHFIPRTFTFFPSPPFPSPKPLFTLRFPQTSTRIVMSSDDDDWWHHQGRNHKTGHFLRSLCVGPSLSTRNVYSPSGFPGLERGEGLLRRTAYIEFGPGCNCMTVKLASVLVRYPSCVHIGDKRPC